MIEGVINKGIDGHVNEKLEEETREDSQRAGWANSLLKQFFVP